MHSKCTRSFLNFLREFPMLRSSDNISVETSSIVFVEGLSTINEIEVNNLIKIGKYVTITIWPDNIHL